MKQIIKNIFLDILFLYKNFIHWNFSKILIYVYSILVSIVFVLPIVLVYFLLSIASWESFALFLSWLVNWNLVPWFGAFFHVIVFLLFGLIFLLATNFLLTKLNINYINWNKPSYKNKDFLDYKSFLSYLWYSLLTILILVLPTIFFTIVLAIMLVSFGWVDEVLYMVSSWPINTFSILALILFIFNILTTIYLFYRLAFGFVSILEDKNNSWVLASIKTSFVLTKWYKKLLKVVFVFLLFGIFYMPFNYMSLNTTWTYNDIGNYVRYINATEEQKYSIEASNKYYYEWLELSYWSIDLKSLEKLQKNYYYYSMIYQIVEFLLIYWFLSMLLVSIYFRIIKE